MAEEGSKSCCQRKVDTRIKAIGEQISRDYAEQTGTFGMCALKGQLFLCASMQAHHSASVAGLYVSVKLWQQHKIERSCQDCERS